MAYILLANKLSLNTDKTKLMMFHTKQRSITYPYLTHILNTLYSNCVLSQLHYCLLPWGYSETILNLQKTAIRATTGSHFKAHADPLFSSLQLYIEINTS